MLRRAHGLPDLHLVMQVLRELASNVEPRLGLRLPSPRYAEERRPLERSLLVGDLGVLELLGRMKAEGSLPADLVLKTSVLMPLGNGPTAALYERVGATSLNISTDLTIPQIAEIRAATTAPIDMYVEVPDDRQTEAEAAGAGMWRGEFTPPWEWRQQ